MIVLVHNIINTILYVVKLKVIYRVSWYHGDENGIEDGASDDDDDCNGDDNGDNNGGGGGFGI